MLSQSANGGSGDGGNRTGTDSGGPYKEYEQYKTASDRYECPSSVSPIWKEAKPFKPGYKTNGLKGNKREYYRWDMGHKDVEVYDQHARYLGSRDPITGKAYRPGDMKVNFQLKGFK